MQLLDARERLICNWGRADWCSWRRRGGSGGGGRGGGGGGGGWPLSNGEGGGGDAAAEVAGLGCSPRRCHHCTEDYSGGGAGSYFPLLPRCCFCRLGRRRARRREREGRGRRRAEPRPCAHPGGRRIRDKRSAVRGGGPAPRSPLPPAHHVLPRPPTRAAHPVLLTPGRLFSAPPLGMPLSPNPRCRVSHPSPGRGSRGGCNPGAA